MNKKEQQFVQTVKDFYKKKGRHVLPWRKTKNPYRIHVSEIMLQQTQVDRVLPKYRNFIQKWGSIEALASVPLSEVLQEWQGLGYNRRAKKLHECSRYIQEKFNGVYPRTSQDLVDLPGIGPYTAGAIMAFTYNEPVSIIETNIRSVYLHHFFKDEEDISDIQLMQLIETTLDRKNPREWYWALMDYGSYLKKEFGNPNKKSTSYTKQSKFEGSDRQIRGAIVRLLAESSCTRMNLLQKLSQFEDIRVDAQLVKLLRENMVQKNKQRYQLPS